MIERGSDMRSININRGWEFALGMPNTAGRLTGKWHGREVNLPHDYMIDAEAGQRLL